MSQDETRLNDAIKEIIHPNFINHLGSPPPGPGPFRERVCAGYPGICVMCFPECHLLTAPVFPRPVVTMFGDAR